MISLHVGILYTYCVILFLPYGFIWYIFLSYKTPFLNISSARDDFFPSILFMAIFYCLRPIVQHFSATEILLLIRLIEFDNFYRIGNEVTFGVILVWKQKMVFGKMGWQKRKKIYVPLIEWSFYWLFYSRNAILNALHHIIWNLLPFSNQK